MNKIIIEYIQKDIFKAFEEREFNFFLHQCNCTAGMGGGIARIIKNKFPFVSAVDNKLIQYDNFQIEFPLKTYGNAFLTKVFDDGYIVNLYSQYYTGNPTDDTMYDTFSGRKTALRRAFKFFLIQVEALDLIGESIELGMPLLASDLAADLELKEGMNTLEYFQRFIEDCFIETKLINGDIPINIKVYYLESALIK